jgi:adenylylsulfate kinase
VLELDAIGKIVTPEPTYSETEREAVYRLLAFMAATLAHSGVPVIVDATARRRHWRELARALIPRFAEVQLDCPPAVCQERAATRAAGNASQETRARDRRPGATARGVDEEYERALAPELTIDTASESVAIGAERIVALAGSLGGESLTPSRPGAGWALWITGLPGSGKTTVAQRVAVALGARGVGVTILDAAAVRQVLGPVAGPGLEDMVHRALACSAKLLTDAGVGVIVDATAPRRRWRELARELIDRFAEIQLVCPAEICAGRERAVRWHLSGTSLPTHQPEVGATPEIVTDYEPSLRPELLLYTDVQDDLAVVEAVLFVAERLHRTGSAAAATR